MIVGHYAPALIAHQRQPRAPLWLFMVAGSLQDLVWVALGLAGVEAPRPSSLLETSFLNMRVEMTYSHDLLPALLWCAVMAGVGYAITRRGAVAAWCAALVGIHEISDVVAGFQHHVLGPSTPIFTTNLYGRAPELAILIEAAFGAACVWWFIRARAASGRPISRSTTIGLYAVFVLGALAWLPTARMPLGRLLGVS